MKFQIGIMSLLTCLLSLFWASCHQAPVSNVDKSKLPTADSPYIKVYVTKAGEITLDGKSANLDEVKTAFEDLAGKKGVVLYSREAKNEDPHPNALEVINLVAKNKLPLRLCMDDDCSDAVDKNGKLKQDN